MKKTLLHPPIKFFYRVQHQDNNNVYRRLLIFDGQSLSTSHAWIYSKIKNDTFDIGACLHVFAADEHFFTGFITTKLATSLFIFASKNCKSIVCVSFSSKKDISYRELLREMRRQLKHESVHHLIQTEIAAAPEAVFSKFIALLPEAKLIKQQTMDIQI